MKKFTSLILLIFICVIHLFSQDEYYYYHDEQKELDIDYSYFYVVLNEPDTGKVILAEGSLNFTFEQIETGHLAATNEKTWRIIKMNDGDLSKSDFQQIRQELIQHEDVLYIGTVIKNETLIPITHLLYVKIFSQSDYTKLEEYCLETNTTIVEQVPYMPLWYKLEVTKYSIGTALEIANKFTESKKFAKIDPGFALRFTSSSCLGTSEAQFNDQWGLSENNSNSRGINACNAWDISLGNEEVVVAVVDQGIEFDHVEFGQIDTPLIYNTEEGYPLNTIYGTHGTSVSGILSARQNEERISGVCPNSTLMSISNKLEIADQFQSGYIDMTARLASGISWAWQNNADVINNSWGAIDKGVKSEILEDAIKDAIEVGRDGLGCTIVFSSGNISTSSTAVEYPANFDKRIIAVGASEINGNKTSSSKYGSSLDIMAPGDNILTTTVNNEYIYFGGTSAAAPHVSGVAALILSVNENLTQQQVKDIIECTAYKLPSYTYTETPGRPNGPWNEETGYGLLDAGAAVEAAQASLTDQFCPCDAYYEEEECCSLFQPYHTHTFTANLTTQTWQPGSNPFTTTTDDVIYIENELIIPNGAIVTIKDMTFRFHEDAQVTIEPGGKLILNNATLTAVECDVMWEGVKATGDFNAVQGNPMSPTNPHAFLRMRNNSEISHAKLGFEGHHGAIIQTHKSLFYNNIVDVELAYYGIFGQGTSISRFTLTDFVTEGLLNEPNELPDTHVRLLAFNDVIFRGCVFENRTPELPEYNVLMNRGVGIGSTHAKFKVRSQCNAMVFPPPVPCPEASLAPCEFNNLQDGIAANSAISSLNADIRNAEFNDNWRGIVLSYMDNPIVRENKFFVGGLETNFPQLFNHNSVGALLANCTGYEVTLNEVFTNTNGHLGIVIDNSGEQYNLVNKNFLHDVRVGVQAQRLNHDLVSAQTGLEIKCNEFESHDEANIAVTSDGIAFFQGLCLTLDPTSAANNQFTNTGVTSTNDYHTNPDVLNLSYQYDPSEDFNTEPLFYTTPQVNPTPCLFEQEFDSDAFQPDTHCPAPIIVKPGPLGPVISLFYDNRDEAEELRQLIDGGDTEGLLTVVNSNMPAGKIKDELLEASPYLSDTVLLAVIYRQPPLPNGVLKEILMANSALPPRVLRALNEINIPKGIENQIMSVQEGIPPRWELEMEIASLLNGSQRKIEETLRYYYHDTTEVAPMDSIRFLLEGLDEVAYRKRLVSVLLSMGDITGAEQLLMELENELPEEEIADFIRLFRLIIEISDEVRICDPIRSDKNLAEELRDIADREHQRRECGHARSLLRLAELDTSTVEIESLVFVADNKSLTVQDKNNTSKLKLYPNPTQDGFFVEFTAPNSKEITYSVYNMLGQEVVSNSVQQTGQLYISAENWRNGLYVITFKDEDGREIEKKKVMIHK